MQSVTSSDFKSRVIESKSIVAVNFWAEWCAPCRAMKPTVEKLADEEGMNIVLANVDECSDQVMEYGIQGVPAVLVFEDGKMVKRMSGLLAADDLREAMA